MKRNVGCLNCDSEIFQILEKFDDFKLSKDYTVHNIKRKQGFLLFIYEEGDL